MTPFRITFIGFGEVAATLSPALRAKGAAISAYDILLDQENGPETLAKRVKTEGVVFLPLVEAVASADLVLSTVTTDVAEAAARSCAPFLRTGQVFIDLNAATPAVKLSVSHIIVAAGAAFAEGAILGAVGVTGAETRILTGGAIAEQAAQTLNRFGLNAAAYSRQIGKASSYKMLRSVFSKGLEALLLEFLIAGKRAGIQADLWQEITELFAKNPFDRIAANWIRTHVGAHGRRYHEMRQVNSVLREIGVDPIISTSVEAFFKRSRELGFRSVFDENPESLDAVIDFMEQRLR